MLLKTEDFVKLAKIAAKANRSTPVAYSFNGENFSYDEVQETLRAQFAELAPDYRGYRENKNTIFSKLLLPKESEKSIWHYIAEKRKE